MAQSLDEIRKRAISAGYNPAQIAEFEARNAPRIQQIESKKERFGILPIAGAVGGGILGTAVGNPLLGAGAGAMGGVALKQMLNSILGGKPASPFGTPLTQEQRLESGQQALEVPAAGAGAAAGELLFAPELALAPLVGKGMMSPSTLQGVGRFSLNKILGRVMPGKLVETALPEQVPSSRAMAGAKEAALGRKVPYGEKVVGRGLTGGSGSLIRKSEKKIVEELEPQLLNAAKNIQGTPPTAQIFDRAVESLRGELDVEEFARLMKNKNALLKEASDVSTWEDLISLKRKFDFAKPATELGAIKSKLKRQIADEIRIELSAQSDDVAQILSEESFWIGVQRAAQKSASMPIGSGLGGRLAIGGGAGAAIGGALAGPPGIGAGALLGTGVLRSPAMALPAAQLLRLLAGAGRAGAVSGGEEFARGQSVQ